jgi:ribosome maturation factor RimP
MTGKRDVLYNLIEPAVSALGFELWGIEFASQGRHSTLRVYIDGPEGINVDDCASVSYQVSGVLDVEDPISGEYTLEVSSPGLERPLFNVEQYRKYIGEHISVKTRMPFDGRRRFSGCLTEVENDEIVLQVENHEYLLPIETIDKAHLVAKI